MFRHPFRAVVAAAVLGVLAGAPAAGAHSAQPVPGSAGSGDLRTPAGSTASSGSVYPAPTVSLPAGVGSVVGTALGLIGGSVQITAEPPGSLDLGVGSVRLDLAAGAATATGWASGYLLHLQDLVDAGAPLPDSAMVVFAASPTVQTYQRQALAHRAGGPFPTALTTTEQAERYQG